ncbi:MAG: 23S rRNA (adenine(2503)-C(2))-methyltransferase RlmN [Planctomycetes bacterium]|nr:23S rRNA (adenine(2503)-C(2))-methyltransferase RlmN [Planctomycetota bacterium]
MTVARSVAGFSQAELESLFVELGEAPYRARQVQGWVFRRRAGTCTSMTDLPNTLRSRLEEACPVHSSRVAEQRRSEDGSVALVVELADGEAVECVLIPEGRRRTVCVSTQVGCAMGCVFCASGLAGIRRDLEAGEVVEQFLHATRLLPAEEAITHVVLMGMGEPLANYREVVKALRVLNAPWGGALGARRLTLSTVGVSPSSIDRLAGEGIPIRLAISLHAADDELRRRIIPTASRVSVADLVAAARRYREATGRDVTFEYTLIRGVNDDPRLAHQLAELLEGLSCNVNVIPLNPVAEIGLEPPAPGEVEAFMDVLRRAGVVVRHRRKRGGDVEAACGQLRLGRLRASGGGASCRS